MTGFEFFAGIDWGSGTHHVCVVDSDGETLGERAFGYSGNGLVEMTDWLLGTTNTQPHAIGVAIEAPHGPVVETMMEGGFTVHSVNPKQLDRFRDRWSPAGGKDDRRDAWTLADALRTDDQAFRRQKAARGDLDAFVRLAGRDSTQEPSRNTGGAAIGGCHRCNAQVGSLPRRGTPGQRRRCRKPGGCLPSWLYATTCCGSGSFRRWPAGRARLVWRRGNRPAD